VHAGFYEPINSTGAITFALTAVDQAHKYQVGQHGLRVLNRIYLFHIR